MEELNRIYNKATDPKTTDNYASSLRRRARILLLGAQEPQDNWPPWVEEGAQWQEPVSRDEPVEYPPELSEDVIAALEAARTNNNPAVARALCRSLDIDPPPWARR